MNARISKWGNSLALRIPRKMAAQLALGEGEEVDLAVDGGMMTITPRVERRRKLEELVNAITPENRHEVVDWGLPVGREEW